MKIIGTTFEKLPRERLVIGFEGENLRATVRIDCASVFAEYPNATPTLIVKPLFADAYPVVVDRNGTDVDWLITSEILSFSGDGEIQLVFYKDQVICKSAVSKIRVSRSLQVTGDMPDPVAQWIDDANRKLAEVDAQIVELEGMVDTATDAATRAEQSASTASTKAEQAAGSAATATAKATEATNAAGTATAKAAEAALSATQASNSAMSAADSERGATAKAGEATTAAGTATAKAEQATEAEQTATEKAGDASASATAAHVSEINAAESADDALSAEVGANAAKRAAETSATQAGTSERNAGIASQTATQKAAEATQSATNAETFAGTATAKAEEAAASAQAASDAKTAVEETAEQLADSLEQIDQNTQDIAEHEQYAEATYATKNDLYKKADIIHNTASGAIASFPDGAEMPVDEVTAQINPVQDLHGYDSPWPAGGGKNLLKWENGTATIKGVTFTVNADGSVTANGTASDGDASFYSEPQYPYDVAFKAGSYILSGCPSGGTTSTYFFNETQKGVSDTGNGASFTLDEDKNLRIRIVIRNGVTVNNVLFKPMICLSSASNPTTFAPYSNICPITGCDGLTMTRTGKNLLDDSIKAVFGSRLLIGATSIYDNPTYLKAGTYSITVFGVNQTFAYLMKSQNALKTIVNGTNHGSFTVDNDGYYRIDLYGNIAISGDVTGAILVPSSTYATAYEPYQGETYEVEFPSEAGTVYGGSLTIAEDGSGVLTVDRAMVTFDGSRDENWQKYGTPTSEWTRQSWRTSALPYPIKERSTAWGECITNGAILAKSSSEKTSSDDDSITCRPTAYTSSIFYIFTPLSLDMSSTDLCDMLAGNPVEFCYPLATPITYTLTAPEITTLLGQNNLWHDANGDISVGYKADTKLYIDNKIAELVARIVNS